MPSFKHLRTKLLISMLAVVTLLTAAVLILVQWQLRQHVRQDLVSTLRANSDVSTQIASARREQIEQSVALIADQPLIKALMSTNDRPTVQDASAGILQASHADLLVLENTRGDVLALHAKSDDVPNSTAEQLMQSSTGTGDWWFAAGHLYEVGFAPIVAGANSDLRPLGRMALGREVTAKSIIGGGALGKSDFLFARQGSVMLSSMPRDTWSQVGASLARFPAQSEAVQEVYVTGERYLVSFVDLPGDHPVRLYSLQSYDQATSFLGSLNSMLLTFGAFAVLAGACIAFAVSRQITKPLEQLVSGTRQLEKGDFDFQIPVQGVDEVADLTRSFEEMRKSLKQSREGMLRSARLEAVGRLAGGVAHDFNNLVMIIKGYSELLLDSATPEARPQLEEIRNAGERASGLTRQLLAFSRKQVLEPQILDPNQSVRNMAKMLRVLIGEDIELITKFSEPIGRVQADPGQLEQVVMNLAVNARDAMPTGGKLIIETQSCNLDASYAAIHSEVSPGPYVLIAVTDSGCGMTKDVLEHIFEPFFTTKELGKGTGLGLATVYGIVKQSQGHVTVYSEPGMGTTFKVYLPSLDKSIPVPVSGQTTARPKGAGTILLVEDEAPLRRLAVESLRRLGYTVLEAGNGLEALAEAEKHPGTIDVVVTDIVMPRMGGPELVQNLRRKGLNFAVVFMSGYTETAVLENAKIGSDAILLNKPFSSDLLARRINELQRKPMDGSHKSAAAHGSG